MKITPPSFDMDYFKSLTSFNKRIQYCEEHLQRISSGSARIVYKIDNEKVLKLAKNKKGIAQNEVEAQYGEDYLIGGYGIFAEVFDVHPDHQWIEMELARKLTKPIFKQITGYDFDTYSDILIYYNDNVINAGRTRFKRSKPQRYDEAWEDSDGFVYNMLSYIGDYQPPIGDLTRMSSYGLFPNNEIKVIDYGLDHDTLSSYYS